MIAKALIKAIKKADRVNTQETRQDAEYMTGKITDKRGDSLVIDGKQYKVRIAPNTRFSSLSDYLTGDRIVAKIERGMISAIAFYPLPDPSTGKYLNPLIRDPLSNVTI